MVGRAKRTPGGSLLLSLWSFVQAKTGWTRLTLTSVDSPPSLLLPLPISLSPLSLFSDLVNSSVMIRKNESSSTALSKRARVEDEDDTPTLTVAIGSTSSGGKPEAGALIRTVKRTSGLEAPIVSLSGAHGVSNISLSTSISRRKRARRRGTMD